jgi:uncharacterized protein DUF4129
LTRSLRSSPERALAAFFLAGALFLGAVPASAQAVQTDQEAVRSKVWEVLKDPRYQREMPKHRQPEVSRKPVDSGPGLGGDGGGGGLPPVAVPSLGAGAALGKLVFIVLLVVAAVLLGGWIFGAVSRRWQKPEAGGTVQEEEPPEAARVREPVFDEAARLAAEGRYAEAVHALLLAAIRHFAARSRVTVEPSRTSRELVRLLPLGAEARAAFSDLVRTVELSLFGGASVGREEYERSLARFQDLTRRAA